MRNRVEERKIMMNPLSQEEFSKNSHYNQHYYQQPSKQHKSKHHHHYREFKVEL